MSKIKDVFYNFNNSEEYASLGEMPEVKAADQQFKAYAKHFDKDEYIILEEIVTANAATNEMQGFVYGFRYAIQLMMECMPKGGASNG